MEFVWYAATFAIWSPFLLHHLTELTYTGLNNPVSPGPQYAPELWICHCVLREVAGIQDGAGGR